MKDFWGNFSADAPKTDLWCDFGASDNRIFRKRGQEPELPDLAWNSQMSFSQTSTTNRFWGHFRLYLLYFQRLFCRPPPKKTFQRDFGPGRPGDTPVNGGSGRNFCVSFPGLILLLKQAARDVSSKREREMYRETKIETHTERDTERERDTDKEREIYIYIYRERNKESERERT